MSLSREELLDKLADAVVRGSRPGKRRRPGSPCGGGGLTALEAINDGLVKGMSIVGDKYAAHEVYLPQVLMSAHTMYGGLDILLPAIPKSDVESRKKCLIAVVEGDVHDIGKNIVKTMITASGFDVNDLGKDVPIQKIVETAEADQTNVVAMSTLMTPTMDGMKAAIDGLVESGYRAKCKVIIGGAPTSPSFAETIGADYRGANAQDGAAYLKEVL